MDKTEIISGIMGIVLFFALIIYSVSSSGFTMFLHIFLLFGGLTLSILMFNKISKSSNSLRSKIFFNFIISFSIFFSIIFFWFLGDHSSIDDKGIATFFVIFSSLLFLFLSFMIGVSLSFKRKEKKDFEYSLKKLTLIATLVSVVLLLIFFFNPFISVISKLSNDAGLCRLSITTPSSYMFSPSKESYCFVNVAVSNGDDKICEQVCNVEYLDDGLCKSNNLYKCYMQVSRVNDDINVCLNGNQFGVENMAFCVKSLAERTKNPQLCEYISGGNRYVEGLDGWGRDFCISQVAPHLDNRELCNTIKDEETKNDCLEEKFQTGVIKQD